MQFHPFGFIKKHWRGQFPLWVAACIGIPVLSLCWAIQFIDYDGDSLQFTAGVFIAHHIATTALMVWWLWGLIIATFQKNTLLYNTVFIMSAWQMAHFVVMLFAVTIPEASNLADMAFFGDSRIPAYAISVTPDSVRFKGGIRTGSAAALKAALDANPAIKTLELNSMGGRLFEALEMANLVSSRKMNTVAIKQCASACTVVFLSGAQRTLVSPAHLGFHQASRPWRSDEDKKDELARNGVIYTTLGMPKPFVEHILATPPNKIWEPSYEELKQAHAVTKITEKEEEEDDQ